MRAHVGFAVVFVAIAGGCGKSNAEPERGAPAIPAVPGQAEIGKPAPEFTLEDLDGVQVALTSFRGKTVVLEWFNPDCPFVRRTHQGPLKTLAKETAKNGGVWLGVNSGAPGKQGHGRERNRQALVDFALEHPILLDESGAVGKSYKARNTPGMYVIDANGVLVYAGAIDNAPDGEKPAEGYRNYVEEALADVNAKRPVRTPETKQYGCSVKYPD